MHNEKLLPFFPLTLLLLHIGVWRYDAYILSNWRANSQPIAQVALDPESTFAMQHTIPVDLVPTDLFEEIPGISSSTAERLSQKVDEYCQKKEKGQKDDKQSDNKQSNNKREWNWEDVPSVGAKRSQLLAAFLQPPLC